jgi:pSer/pThr/pTyr-binding forkhead associated (FHA) protein
MAKESRLEILKGKDAGLQFRITGDRVVFGRAEDSDIIVNDSVASRHHAELVRIGASFLIKDLGSSNGTYVNGNKTTEHYLMNNDVFSIGDHSYRYIEVEGKEQKQYNSAVMEGNTIPGISIKSLSSDINIPKAGGKTASKKRLIIYGALGVFIIFILIILLSGGDAPKEAKDEKAKTPEQIAEDELTKKEDEGMDKVYKRKIPEEDREVYENANQFYFEGRRELRLKNYSRALDLFRKALMLYPEHAKSSYYVKITQEFMKQESELQMKLGRKMLEHKRYNEAIRHFTEVINLNARELESSIAKEAQKWRGIAEKERDRVTQE